MTEIKTNESLLAQLKQAAKQALSAEERKEQRVSFIYASIDRTSTLTRQRIREIVEERSAG